VFKIKENYFAEDGLIGIGELKPCEIAVIVDRSCDYFGEIVMRTSSDSKFEVMSLSKPGENKCWTYPSIQAKIMVKKLKKGDEITLVVV
jgi:hypothetical protein